MVSAVACNGKGTCSGSSEYKCTCYEGWSSFDCSKRDCPSGRVWWGDVTAVDTSHVATAICSNAGLCDYSSGTCSCFSGYSGTACDRSKSKSLEKAVLTRFQSIVRVSAADMVNVRVWLSSRPWERPMVFKTPLLTAPIQILLLHGTPI